MKGKYSTYVNGVRTKITPVFAASHGIIQVSKAPRRVPAEAARCWVPINYMYPVRYASIRREKVNRMEGESARARTGTRASAGNRETL